MLDGATMPWTRTSRRTPHQRRHQDHPHDDDQRDRRQRGELTGQRPSYLPRAEPLVHRRLRSPEERHEHRDPRADALELEAAVGLVVEERAGALTADQDRRHHDQCDRGGRCDHDPSSAPAVTLDEVPEHEHRQDHRGVHLDHRAHPEQQARDRGPAERDSHEREADQQGGQQVEQPDHDVPDAEEQQGSGREHRRDPGHRPAAAGQPGQAQRDARGEQRVLDGQQPCVPMDVVTGDQAWHEPRHERERWVLEAQVAIGDRASEDLVGDGQVSRRFAPRPPWQPRLERLGEQDGWVQQDEWPDLPVPEDGATGGGHPAPA